MDRIDHMADWREKGRSRAGLSYLQCAMVNNRGLESYVIDALAACQDVISNLPDGAWERAANQARGESIAKHGRPSEPLIVGGDEAYAVNLLPFCSTERDEIASPWTCDGFTYATDGRILIRVPRRSDAPYSSYPDVSTTWSYFLETAKASADAWTRLPDLTPDVRAFLVGRRAVSATYLRLIAALPLPEVCVHHGDRSEPLAFRFAGLGAGLLMPLRTCDTGEYEYFGKPHPLIGARRAA